VRTKQDGLGTLIGKVGGKDHHQWWVKLDMDLKRKRSRFEMDCLTPSTDAWIVRALFSKGTEGKDGLIQFFRVGQRSIQNVQTQECMYIKDIQNVHILRHFDMAKKPLDTKILKRVVVETKNGQWNLDLERSIYENDEMTVAACDAIIALAGY